MQTTAIVDARRSVRRGAARVLAGCLALSSGCLSDRAGSGSLAYVEIESASEAAIRRELLHVFKEDGYELSASTVQGMAFEREATRRDSVMYGHFGDDYLRMRVDVRIIPLTGGGYRLQSDAFALRSGDRDPVSRIGRGPFRGQLRRTRDNLAAQDS